MILNLRFESTVKTKGYQTCGCLLCVRTGFESTVKTKGYQTAKTLHCAGHKFESTVNLYTIKLEMELIAKAA